MSIDFEQEFRTRKQQHYTALKESYEKLVNAAYDKKYSARTYTKLLFDSILEWKSNSEYFNRILALLVHYSKLDPRDVMNPLIENMQSLKDEAYDSFPLFEAEEDTTHDLYFLQLEDIELVDHLAKFLAALDLSKKHAQNTSKELSSTQDPEKKKLNRFTRNQQLLALYYTLKVIEIEPRRTTDMTNYTRLIHLLSGVDYNKVQNDIFYSKVKHLPNILTDQYLKKDLEFIRAYFVKTDAHSIVEQIDLEINGC